MGMTPSDPRQAPRLAGWLVGAALTGMAILFGCQSGSETSETADKKLTVAVSILPQAWVVRQIGGESIQVMIMVKPGESAELYQPTDAQISQVMGAAVYFCIGMPLENSPGFQAIKSHGKPQIVDMNQGITLREMVGHDHYDEQAEGEQSPTSHEEADSHHDHASEAPREEHSSGGCLHAGKDPHVWLSPPLLKIQARTVARTLGKIDPIHAPQYDRNLAAVETQINELDKSLRTTLAPLRGTAFLVFHPAWGYFADEYGLREMSIEAEGKDPSDRELTRLQNQARAEKIRVIFAQPQTSRRSADAIALAIGARVEMLDGLSEDVPGDLRRTAQKLVEAYHP